MAMRRVRNIASGWHDADQTRDLVDKAITHAVSHMLGDSQQAVAFATWVRSELVLRAQRRHQLGPPPEQLDQQLRELEQRGKAVGVGEPVIAQSHWVFDGRRSAAILLAAGLAGVALDAAHVAPRGLLIVCGGLLTLLLTLGPWRLASRARASGASVVAALGRLALRWRLWRERRRLCEARVRYARHQQWVEQRVNLVLGVYELYRRRAELSRAGTPRLLQDLSRHLNGNGHQGPGTSWPIPHTNPVEAEN
jgi:hypothetical protein